MLMIMNDHKSPGTYPGRPMPYLLGSWYQGRYIKALQGSTKGFSTRILVGSRPYIPGTRYQAMFYLVL